MFSFLTSSSSLNFLEYGWNIVNDKIEIVWEDSEIMEKVKGTKTCGCKGAKCDGTTSGCRNCYKMCKPCTLKCKCKAQCRNLHNNGGKCPRCAPSADIDSDDNSDHEDNRLKRKYYQLFRHHIRKTLIVNLTMMVWKIRMYEAS